MTYTEDRCRISVAAGFGWFFSVNHRFSPLLPALEHRPEAPNKEKLHCKNALLLIHKGKGKHERKQYVVCTRRVRE